MTTGSVRAAGMSTVKWCGSISFGTPKPIVFLQSLLHLRGVDLDLAELLEELLQIGAAAELEFAEADLGVGGLLADGGARGAMNASIASALRTVPVRNGWSRSCRRARR